jgi:hypothetical protein
MGEEKRKSARIAPGGSESPGKGIIPDLSQKIPEINQNNYWEEVICYERGKKNIYYQKLFDFSSKKNK